ncbi:hypothetical protein NPIL_312641 [Nephila pilipes]|uniref:Uncharacterized protein n=1 Tax=Nephila pilipes TaxID=299642 RepID=A0A8X6TB10_NEPPI|nr:hypothetical protein NPIL_312641 [Nephila pilipes]
MSPFHWSPDWISTVMAYLAHNDNLEVYLRDGVISKLAHTTCRFTKMKPVSFVGSEEDKDEQVPEAHLFTVP